MLHPPCGCRDPLHCIVPPYLLERLAEHGGPRLRRAVLATIAQSSDARAVRRTLAEAPGLVAPPGAPAGRKPHRLIHDAGHGDPAQLPGRLVRREGDPPGPDVAVNEAYTHSGTVHGFWLRRFARHSLDGRGMPLVSSVHVGRDHNNAFWNGRQMAYGDGDGRIFLRFTKALDVVGHELTHGVISHECNLEYRDQSGALNEHLADVFGVLVRQWKGRQRDPRKAEWRIGGAIMGPDTRAAALRDMGPAKAFENDPLLGTDPQPKHLRGLYRGSADNGGVHINSGIPNHAFWRFATALPGPAWETPGAIWYEALRLLTSTSDFAEMARLTDMIVVRDFGARSAVHRALREAWKGVGV